MDWLDDLESWQNSPAKPTPKLQPKQSRRRSLRILRRQSVDQTTAPRKSTSSDANIDADPLKKELDCSEDDFKGPFQVCDENIVKLMPNHAKKVKDSYGTVWVDDENASPRPAKCRRQSITKAKSSRKSLSVNHHDLSDKENNNPVDTFDENKVNQLSEALEVDKLWTNLDALSVFSEKPKNNTLSQVRSAGKRRQSLYKKQRRRSLMISSSSMDVEKTTLPSPLRATNFVFSPGDSGVNQQVFLVNRQKVSGKEVTPKEENMKIFCSSDVCVVDNKPANLPVSNPHQSNKDFTPPTQTGSSSCALGVGHRISDVVSTPCSSQKGPEHSLGVKTFRNRLLSCSNSFSDSPETCRSASPESLLEEMDRQIGDNQISYTSPKPIELIPTPETSFSEKCSPVSAIPEINRKTSSYNIGGHVATPAVISLLGQSQSQGIKDNDVGSGGELSKDRGGVYPSSAAPQPVFTFSAAFESFIKQTTPEVFPRRKPDLSPRETENKPMDLETSDSCAVQHALTPEKTSLIDITAESPMDCESREEVDYGTDVDSGKPQLGEQRLSSPDAAVGVNFAAVMSQTEWISAEALGESAGLVRVTSPTSPDQVSVPHVEPLCEARPSEAACTEVSLEVEASGTGIPTLLAGRKRKLPSTTLPSLGAGDTCQNTGDPDVGSSVDDDESGRSARRSTRLRRKSIPLIRPSVLMEPETDSPTTSVEDTDTSILVDKKRARKRKRKTAKEENVEEIYLNKLYKKPVERMYATIFEEPARSLSFSQRRLRRSITFDPFTPQPSKNKKRSQKAAKLGWGPTSRRKRAITNTEFDKRLLALEEELGNLDTDTDS